MTTDLSWSSKLRPEVSERWDELIQLRREFHRMPELSFKEHSTVARIKDWLAAQGVENVNSVTETGVVALIEGAQPGRTIMYRADIDALPVEEDSGVDYPSEHPGVMHACGHDGHVAIALMVASILNVRRESLQGNVKVVFQPAEEVGGGAEPMIDAGVMENPHVDAVLGLHMAAMMHVGTQHLTGDVGERNEDRTHHRYDSRELRVVAVADELGHGELPVLAQIGREHAFRCRGPALRSRLGRDPKIAGHGTGASHCPVACQADRSVLTRLAARPPSPATPAPHLWPLPRTDRS